MNEITELDVIAAIAARGGVARLLGGRAVMNVCGDGMPDVLRRHSADIDLVTRGRDRRALKSAMADIGCEAEEEFNLLNGKERMIFHAGGTKIDIFIDVFRMCHTLHFGDRLALHPITLSPCDLLLTKLQVFHAEHKDLSDAAALLLCCDLLPGSGEASTIDALYLSKLLGEDWGLWRTVTGTLRKLDEQAGDICKSPVLMKRLRDNIRELIKYLDSAPRSMGWRMRSIIGERSIWYELPEEPTTTHPHTKD